MNAGNMTMALVFYGGTLPGAVTKDIKRMIDLLGKYKSGTEKAILGFWKSEFGSV